MNFSVKANPGLLTPKQPGELSLHRLAKNLKISDHTVVRYLKPLNRIPSFRKGIAKGKTASLIHERDLPQILKILEKVFQGKKQEGELCPSDLAQRYKLTVKTICYHKNKIRTVPSFREATVGAELSFFVHEEDLLIIDPVFKKISSNKKRRWELSIEDLARKFKLASNTIRKHKNNLKFIPSFREIQDGRASFFIHRIHVKQARAIVCGGQKAPGELSVNDLSSRLGISSSTILRRTPQFQTLPGFRAILSYGKPSFLIHETDLPQAYEILEKTILARVFENFIKDLSQNKNSLPVPIQTNQYGIIIGSNATHKGKYSLGKNNALKKILLLPNSERIMGIGDFYWVLPHWPASLHEMSQPNWWKKSELVTKLNPDPSWGVVMFYKFKEILKFKKLKSDYEPRY